jgi:hypothetical protein
MKVLVDACPGTNVPLKARSASGRSACGMKLVPADKIPGAGEGEHEREGTTTLTGGSGKT